jgi:hypothetical protein
MPYVHSQLGAENYPGSKAISLEDRRQYYNEQLTKSLSLVPSFPPRPVPQPMPQGVSIKDKEEYYQHLVSPAGDKFRHNQLIKALEIDEDLYYERRLIRGKEGDKS